MATGEKKWSTEGKSVKRVSFEPLPGGEYTFKVKRGWEVRKSESEKSSQLRYANGYFEVMGTAKGEDGKNRRHYHSFHCDLSPGTDGEAMPNRSGQLVEFGKAVNEKFVLDLIQQNKRLKDGTYMKVDTLNPKQLVEQLNNLDGTEFRARLKVEKDFRTGELTNVVDFFVEAEESGNEDGEEPDEEELEEADEDGDIDEDVDEADDAEDDADADEDAEEDSDEDESDDDDLPEPPSVKKAPKDTGKRVVQGPAKKNVAKKKAKK